MITPSFDFTTRLAELADDLSINRENLPPECYMQVGFTVRAMDALAAKLHPAIFDEPKEIELSVGEGTIFYERFTKEPAEEGMSHE